MPLLLAWLVHARAGAVARAAAGWLAVGIVFAWIGDLLRSWATGDAAFVGGIAAFLVMQVCYLVACTERPRAAAWSARGRSRSSPTSLIWPGINA